MSKHITPEEGEAVLNYFYNNNDNRSGVISKVLKLPLRKVNYILDLHISRKKNYNGEPLNKVKHVIPNRKSIAAYDEQDNLLGEFTSIISCGKELGVNPGCISKYFAGSGKGMYINHKGSRKMRYELVS